MNLNGLPFNLFDLALLILLVVGIFRGRKHGMSEELPSLLKWLLVVAVCGYFYQSLGVEIAKTCQFSLLTSYVFAYAAMALVILGLFALSKNLIESKLVGSDLFGHGEYYLGMGSGLIRFSCIILAAMALLNARYFSPAEVQAMERFQNDVYGSNFFPGLHSAQEVVFEKSLSGAWIRDHLSFLLIVPTPPEDKSFHQKEAELPH